MEADPQAQPIHPILSTWRSWRRGGSLPERRSSARARDTRQSAAAIVLAELVDATTRRRVRPRRSHAASSVGARTRAAFVGGRTEEAVARACRRAGLDRRRCPCLAADRTTTLGAADRALRTVRVDLARALCSAVTCGDRRDDDDDGDDDRGSLLPHPTSRSTLCDEEHFAITSHECSDTRGDHDHADV